MIKYSGKTFEAYHLSDNAKIITKSVPGPKSIELLKIQARLESNNRSYPRSIPLAFDLARGAIIQDVDENRYIDFFAGCGVLNLGHNNSYILEALKKYEGKIVQAVDFPTGVKIDFMQHLLALLPKTLRGKCKINFGGPTGADAVETALKLARINTGRHSIIAFHGGYHGMTMGALSVTSKLSHRDKVPPLIPGVHFMPYCSPYRCPFAKGSRKCDKKCIQYFKNVLENPHSGIDKPAAIIVEPVQGEGGTYIPSKGWLEEITKIARENGLLVIFDEIQSGFYRTGRLFAFEHTRAVPDIITMSKGIGGIGFPLSLIIYRKSLDIWDSGTHMGTFRGNQIAMEAGISAMEFIEKKKLIAYSKRMGREILNSLKRTQKDSKFIGDVRGIGMMFGVEYVKNKRNKEPFSGMAQLVRKRCYESGLLVEIGGYHDNVIRFLPPLILTSTIMKNGLDIFRKASRLAEKEMKQQGMRHDLTS